MKVGVSSYVYFIAGQKDKLEKLLNQARPKTKNTADYVFSIAYLEVLKSDIKEANAIIRRFAEDRPNDIVLAIEKSRLDLLDDSSTVQEAAIKRIFDIAESSSRSLVLLLNIMNSLLSYHMFDEAEEIFKYLDVEHVNLEDFIIFKTVSAWSYTDIGDYENAALEIELALKMAPKDLAANWLKVLLTKKLERPDLALGSLEVLLKANPYNESYRDQIAHFRDKYKTPELEGLYQRMLEHH